MSSVGMFQMGCSRCVEGYAMGTLSLGYSVWSYALGIGRVASWGIGSDQLYAFLPLALAFNV